MNALRQFRTIAFAEGLSYLTLLFVAMPLKYWLGVALAVRIVGSLHGLLFVLFLVTSLRAAVARRWSLARWGLAFLSSLVPFAMILLDRSLKAELQEMA